MEWRIGSTLSATPSSMASLKPSLMRARMTGLSPWRKRPARRIGAELSPVLGEDLGRVVLGVDAEGDEADAGNVGRSLGERDHLRGEDRAAPAAAREDEVGDPDLPVVGRPGSPSSPARRRASKAGAAPRRGRSGPPDGPAHQEPDGRRDDGEEEDDEGGGEGGGNARGGGFGRQGFFLRERSAARSGPAGYRVMTAVATRAAPRAKANVTATERPDDGRPDAEGSSARRRAATP